MSLGPIPWKAIHDYCVAYSLNEDQMEEMHHHMKEMDLVYLAYQKRKK